MAVYVCKECGNEREARCKPRKCHECGAQGSYEKKE
ncbi:MAG: rubredoxin [Thermoanaerobacteraceae bacterium]|nr:rubredoxin [Thermoanaerobacteraceae bacterium]